MTIGLRELLAYGVLPAFSLTLFTACGGGGTEAKAAAPEPEHPWDWVPEDPELVLGGTIYNNECALCHNEGEQGAPRLGSSKKWGERAAKGTPKLIESAINGIIGPDGEMPPKGDAPHLTNEEIAAAVKFMVAAPK